MLYIEAMAQGIPVIEIERLRHRRCYRKMVLMDFEWKEKNIEELVKIINFNRKCL